MVKKIFFFNIFTQFHILGSDTDGKEMEVLVRYTNQNIYSNNINICEKQHQFPMVKWNMR